MPECVTEFDTMMKKFLSGEIGAREWIDFYNSYTARERAEDIPKWEGGAE